MQAVCTIICCQLVIPAIKFKACSGDPVCETSDRSSDMTASVFISGGIVVVVLRQAVWLE